MTEPPAPLSQAKDAAARLAARLACQEPHTRVPSREAIAADLGISPGTAQNARNLLQGTGTIYKSGRHLYVSPCPPAAPQHSSHGTG